jgi:UDP-3-O-[3-hydroxymyristoyl] glucosamine N-acyltransferase
MKLNCLAEKLGAMLEGSGDVEITGVAGLNEANQGHITFVNENRFTELEQIRASAAIVPLNAPKLRLPLLRVKNPRLAFARAVELFTVTPRQPSGINERAVIGKNVVIGADPSIHPYVVIADEASIGDRVTIYPGVWIGKGTTIGNDAVIYSNVNIRENIRIGNRVIIHAGATIGSDGFGYATEDGIHHKIPQMGGVIIGDDVEIGANSTIDRATLGNTVIKQGTKIDNLVHVAHNVTIGEHCFLIAQVGIGGSCTLGNYVVLAGQVGLADHVTIGDRTMVSAQSGVIRNIEPGQMMGGYYAMPQREWLKVQAIIPKLPELKKQVADLGNQVQELRKNIPSAREHPETRGAEEPIRSHLKA